MAQKRMDPALLWHHLRLFIKDRFNLDDDQATEEATIEEIKKGIIFRGTNLWILMFAILVASVGLNVNSPAVVIGAMLISPLMGPIMGVGLGVGINDFELIIKALRNLAIAVVLSVLTSALYFWISPLDDAQSELLARTSPTLWDVLIALFGGLAGIVAGSRKEKSNAIPGVAIATALMPPLCTAGFGLATAQWNYFFGAFYLFFINSVFISFSTYLIVRLLRYKRKEFVDEVRERTMKRYIYLFVLLTIIPSVYTAYQVVIKSFFERNANLFINQELQFETAQVIGRKVTLEDNEKRIEVTLFGEPISEELILQAEKQLPQYHLDHTELIVRQGYQEDNAPDLQTIEELNLKMRAGIIEDLYERNEEIMKGKDDQIKLLEEEILRLRARELPIADLSREIKTINKNIEELSLSNSIVSHLQDSTAYDTVCLAYVKFARRPKEQDRSQIREWLKARIKTDTVKLITAYD
ncbi:MAG: TIGR00341 family protein [Bacteroidota bacterium]